jgi:acyl-CoA reductase-like NAD-dependent aldehyde dehydrogenase
VSQARGEILHKLADLMEENEDELAYLETLDNGKPLRMSKYDLRHAVKHVRVTAGMNGVALIQAYRT